MPVTRHNYNSSGLLLHTGAHIRKRDPREDKYGLLRSTLIDAIHAVDLSQEHSLLKQDASGNLWDPRPAITNQGQKGACAAFAAVEAAEMNSWQMGNGAPVLLSGSDLYERVRKLENPHAWQEDTGSTLADNLDLAMTGLYSVADAPDSDDLGYNYDALTAGKTTYDYVLGHQPFYPNDDGGADPLFMVKAIAYCLDQGWPVDLGSYWPDVWFNPDSRGVLPMQGVKITSQTGGHSYLAYSVLPILGGVVACPNHWTPQWNPQVAAQGYHLRPGDFLVPFAAFTPSAGILFEARSVTWTAVTPQPSPQPAPGPAGCKPAALAVAQPIVDAYQTAADANRHSYVAKYRLVGAKAVADALANAAL